MGGHPLPHKSRAFLSCVVTDTISDLSEIPEIPIRCPSTGQLYIHFARFQLSLCFFLLDKEHKTNTPGYVVDAMISADYARSSKKTHLITYAALLFLLLKMRNYAKNAIIMDAGKWLSGVGRYRHTQIIIPQEQVRCGLDHSRGSLGVCFDF